MAGPAATPVPRPAPAVPPAPAAGRRLAWLDVLRGIAALSVVFDHLGHYVLQHVERIVYQWLNTGQYGVFVFFLVSGYIVPASLERKGSVRGFWLSRVFRLYPLYLLAMAAAVVLWQLGVGSLRGADRRAETAAFSHLLMLSNVLGTPNALNVVWTLSYEMAFYLLLTVLFVFRVHRHSSKFALGFAGAAVAIGGLLPASAALSGSFVGRRRIAMLADLLVLCGIALAVVRHRLPKIVGAVLAAATALVLVAFNGQWILPFQALTILALMFTGTMLYRAERGEFAMRHAAVTALAVFGLVIVAGLWHSHQWNMSVGPEFAWQRVWVTTLVLAGLTFAAGMAWRHKQMPPVLTWLGLISYSLYLLHPLVLEVYYHVPGTRGHHPFPLQVVMAAAFMAALLVCSAATYQFVEAPMQRAGRRLVRWLDRWLVPDTAEPAAAESAAR